MKGVINKGIQALFESKRGREVWESIRAAAHCNETSFAPSLDYPDQMTVDLLVAGASYCDMSLDELMAQAGEYWITNTGRETYPTLFALAGTNVRDFLHNTEDVHLWVTDNISGASPPFVKVVDLPNGKIAVHYASERKLCPVLRGLLLGLGSYFNQTLEVEEVACTRNGDDECVFEIGIG